MPVIVYAQLIKLHYQTNSRLHQAKSNNNKYYSTSSDLLTQLLVFNLPAYLLTTKSSW